VARSVCPCLLLFACLFVCLDEVAEVQSRVHANADGGLVSAETTTVITRAGVGAEFSVGTLVKEVEASGEHTVVNFAPTTEYLLVSTAWASTDFAVVIVDASECCLVDR